VQLLQYNDVLEKVGGYYDTPCNYYNDVLEKVGGYYDTPCNYYNDVLEKVGGYYDTPWHDIDIDVINTELIDFQNKCVVHIP